MTDILIQTLAAAGASQPSGTLLFLWNMAPIFMIIAVMYLLFWRPQQRQMKEHRASLSAIKKGDEVITGGGLRGRVTKVSDDEVEVEIAQGVKVRAVKGTLSQVLTKSTKPAND